MKTGFVYVLTNPGLPRTVKFGQTTRDAYKRASELLREYGRAYPFEIASKHAVSDPTAVEALAHRLLWRCRAPRSELFECEVRTAQKALKKAAARVLERRWWVRLWYWMMLPRPAQGRAGTRGGAVLVTAWLSRRLNRPGAAGRVFQAVSPGLAALASASRRGHAGAAFLMGQLPM